MERASLPLGVKLAVVVLPFVGGAFAACDSGDSGQTKVATAASVGSVAQEATGTIAATAARPEASKTPVPSLVPSATPSLEPSPTALTAKNQALRLAGRDSFVEYPSSEFLQLNGPFTMEAIINLTDDAIPGGKAVAVKGDTGEEYGLWAKLDQCFSLDGIKMGAVVDGKSKCATRLVVPKGRETKIALIYTGRSIIFFMDGIQEEVPIEAVSKVSGSGALRLGISLRLLNEQFHGTMRNVAIFSGARSGTQINADFEAMQRGSFDPKQPGLDFFDPLNNETTDQAHGLIGQPHGNVSFVPIN